MLWFAGFSWLESRESRYNQFTAFQRQFTTRILCKSCCFFSILFQYRGLGVVNSVKMTDGHLHSKQQRKRLSFVSPKEMLYFDKWNLSLLYLSVICKHLFCWKAKDVKRRQGDLLAVNKGKIWTHTSWANEETKKTMARKKTVTSNSANQTVSMNLSG